VTSSTREKLSAANVQLSSVRIPILSLMTKISMTVCGCKCIKCIKCKNPTAGKL
jgi:hypothetical protein